MRTGPGKHLKGLTLMGGVSPEEVRVKLFSLLMHALTQGCYSLTTSTKWVHHS
jgi:hypothetical protein